MAQQFQFRNETRSTVLASRGRLAKSFLSRLRGLLFTKELSEGSGLFLSPCNSIHMFGMTYAIDAVFVDKKGLVVGTLSNFAPWRVSKFYRNAEACLELPVGTVSSTNTEMGDMIAWSPVQ